MNTMNGFLAPGSAGPGNGDKPMIDFTRTQGLFHHGRPPPRGTGHGA